MKKLLEFLVSSIVENPKEIVIEEEPEGDCLNLRLRVHPEDLKIIIGRRGKTIKALRHLLRIKAIKAAKQGEKFNLILEE